MRFTLLLADCGDNNEGMRFCKEYEIDNSTTPVFVLRNGEDKHFNYEIQNIK